MNKKSYRNKNIELEEDNEMLNSPIPLKQNKDHYFEIGAKGGSIPSQIRDNISEIDIEDFLVNLADDLDKSEEYVMADICDFMIKKFSNIKRQNIISRLISKYASDQ